MKLAILGLTVLAGACLTAGGDAKHGTVQRIQVHGKALEGNLEGDSADRDVGVYLPPSYGQEAERRYPVVYLLHGFTDKMDHWFNPKEHSLNLPEIADKALAAGGKEMILVMPDAFTRYQGSMYSNSVTTGDWEEYVAKDLVEYIDGHYRTIADRSGRGLAGHSMGGYGTIRIGMKHPEVYSSLYLLSPCCMSVGLAKLDKKMEAVHDPAEIASADFGTKVMFASSAAWSPNPDKAPLFLDLPFKGGEVQPQVIAKWQANAPLAMIDQYIGNLRQYTAIGMDAGTKDQPIESIVERLDQVLKSYKIGHKFESYDGDHVNRIGERLEKHVLPFFSANLK